MPGAIVWFALGAAFCWLAERARRAPDDDFEERLAELEAEADAREEAEASAQKH